jgi:hypothetical protein
MHEDKVYNIRCARSSKLVTQISLYLKSYIQVQEYQK